MGLDITCGKSTKTYHASYGVLHQIRWLALVACGYPQDRRDIYPSCHVVPAEITPGQINDMMWATVQAGHLFPNLLLHSDCEGTYTKRGKIDLARCMTGNSRGLLKELRLLETMIPESLKGDNPITHYTPWGLFKTLKDLVEDEVEHGKGYIAFH